MNVVPARRSPTVVRWVVRQALPLLAGAGGVVLAVGVLGLGALELRRAPARPDAVGLLGLFLGVLGPVAEAGLPLAAAAGMAELGRRMGAAGVPERLAAAGVEPAALLRGGLAVALLVLLAGLPVAHLLAPAGRARVHASLVARAVPAPGRVLRLGEVHLARAGEGLWVVGAPGPRPWAVHAPRWSLDPGGRGLRLEDGRFVVPGGAGSFREARVRLPAPGREAGRAARPDAALVARAAAGHPEDAQLLHRRTANPLAAAALALAAMGWGLAGRPLRAAVALFAWWGGLRLCDHAVGALGAPLSAWLPTAGTALAAARAWRQRP